MDEAVTSVIGGHWLRFTVPPGSLERVLETMGGRHGDVESLRAYGQPRRIVHETGAVVYFGSDREDQPEVVDLPGEVCEREFDTGLAWCHQLGGNVTRVDLANDVGPDERSRGRLLEMIEAFEQKRVETLMRQGRREDGSSLHVIDSRRPGEGMTAYFGGRTADLRLRVYDRRGPLRLEFEWHPPKPARPHVPIMLLEQGPGGVWRSLARSHVWPMAWYMQLLDGDRVELPPLDDEAVTTLQAAWDQLRDGFGYTFQAFDLLGLTMADLAKPFPEKLRGRDAKKFLGWAREAPAGYDGAKLRVEVEKRLKRSRVVK